MLKITRELLKRKYNSIEATAFIMFNNRFPCHKKTDILMAFTWSKKEKIMKCKIYLIFSTQILVKEEKCVFF